MADNGFKVKNKLNIAPSETETTAAGDLRFDPSDGTFKYHNGTSEESFGGGVAPGTIIDSDIAAGAAIARSKIAAGTPSQVLVNDGSGNLSSTATISKAQGGTGLDNSSVTFPASGVIVTETATETLTNKTISGSSNTISNIPTTALTGTLAISSGGTGQTSAAAAFNALSPLTTTGDLIYEASAGTAARLPIGSTNNVLTVVGGVPTWAAPVSSGGTVTSVSVVSANGLAGSVATSTTTPAITLSTTVTGLLEGNGTAISAATTTGTGSVVRATSPTLVTPVLGTPSSATLTNATGLPLTTGITGTLPVGNGGTGLTSPGTSGNILTSNGTAWVSTTPSGTSNINLPIVTDWVNYSLPITATTTAPTFGTIAINNAKWRRVGDSMEITFTFSQTSTGTGGSGTYLYGLPSGYTIDTSKIQVSSSPAAASNVGSASTNYVNNDYTGFVKAYNSTNLALAIADAANLTIVRYQSDAAGTYLASPISVSFTAKVPISGWSANASTTILGTAITPLVTKARKTGSSTPTAGNPIPFDTSVYDTMSGALNLTTGVFTAPITGYYHVCGTMAFTTASASIILYKNGISDTPLGTLLSAGYVFYGTDVFLTAGDTCYVGSDGSTSFDAGSRLSIHQIK